MQYQGCSLPHSRKDLSYSTLCLGLASFRLTSRQRLRSRQCILILARSILPESKLRDMNGLAIGPGLIYFDPDVPDGRYPCWKIKFLPRLGHRYVFVGVLSWRQPGWLN